MEYQEPGMNRRSTPEGPKLNDSAETIGFVECRMKGNAAKWVMQLPYPQCYFQVHEFESTQHYLDTLGKSQQWLHAQVGSRSIARG